MIMSVKEVRMLKHTARNLIRAYWTATTAEQLDDVGNRMSRICGWLYETLDNRTASDDVMNKCHELLGWIDGHMTSKE